MKLGFIVEPEAPASNYRVIFPMCALERRGHEIVWPSKLRDDVPARAFLDCDLVHCYRRLDRLRDLRALAQRGVAISFDNDDDLAEADISVSADGVQHGAKGRLENIRKFKEILKVVRFADLTTTPSRVLADKYRAAGAEHVAVIENHLDANMAGFGRKARHEGIVIGWVAGKEHESDLELLPITGALERLLERHAHLRLLTVGTRLPLRSERYEYRRWVSFQELLHVAGELDIGIAPLADTPFNRGRSNVKLKEYAAGGAAWLASPVGAYAQMGAREGGRLVADGDWFDALDGLIRGGFKREHLARRGLRWVRSQTVDRFAPVWESEFLGAIERAQARMRAAAAR